MITIAVCGKDSKMNRWLKGKLEQWLQEHFAAHKTEVYASGRALLYEAEEGKKFDLVILDIEIPEADGIELASEIKKHLPEALILFFTECEGRVYDAFRVQPYRFIPVKSAKEMLPEAMESALKLLQNQNDLYYIVENQKGMERIPVKKIAYIWRKEKYAYIEKTTGGNAAVRKPLKQVYGELPEGRFLWIDRGCICNVEQIAMVTGEEVHLFCGARIFISRDRSAQIRRILKTVDS